MNRFLTILSLSLLLGLPIADTFGQRPKKGSTSFYKGRYKTLRVPKNKAKIVCPIFEESEYPYQGIGVKIGDPFAIAYKFYASKRFSVAVDFGSAASGLYSQHHRENFGEVIREDTLNTGQGINYLSHEVNEEWVVEGKVLFQNDATGILPGLQWYIGAGWQWRQVDIDYEYLLEIGFLENEINRTNVTYTTMGPVGVLGIEYAYFELPISAFLEIEGYYDLVENPGWLRLQGGVGLRYVF